MKLKTEEKFAFLHLVQYVAKLDGEYGPKEREIIEEYCMEMGIENVELSQEHFILEETLETFSSPKSRRIALLGLMVLVHIDDKFGIYEHKTMAQIALKFEFEEKQLQYFSMWGKAASAMYEQALMLTEE